MALQVEIQALETAFEAISAQAQALCDDSHSAFCSSEDRINKAFLSITQTTKSDSIAAIDSDDKTTAMVGAWPIEEMLDDLLLAKQCRDFDEIALQTFNSVCEFYRKTHDLRDELANIKKELEGTLTGSQSGVVDAEKDLEERINQEARVKASLQSCLEAVSWVSEETEQNKDRRTVLRTGRVLAWGAGFIWAPALIAAAGMEIGAARMRKKARELERQGKEYQAEYKTLQHEVQRLKNTVSTLRRQAAMASSLFKRCDRLSNELDNKLETIQSQLKKLFDWKLAADTLCSATGEWRTKAEFLLEITDDKTAAASLMQQLIDGIDQTYHAEAHERLLSWTADPTATTVEELLAD